MEAARWGERARPTPRSSRLYRRVGPHCAMTAAFREDQCHPGQGQERECPSVGREDRKAGPSAFPPSASAIALNSPPSSEPLLEQRVPGGSRPVRAPHQSLDRHWHDRVLRFHPSMMSSVKCAPSTWVWTFDMKPPAPRAEHPDRSIDGKVHGADHDEKRGAPQTRCAPHNGAL